MAINEKERSVRTIPLGAAIAVAGFPLVLVFDLLGRPEFERPAYFVSMLMLVIVKVCWDLRNRPWFWIAIIGIAALHVPLVILTAQRLSRMPFRALLFLGVMDCLAILAVIALIERLTGNRDALPVPR